MKKSIISMLTLTALITSFNGCGSSSSTSNNSVDKIDIAQYFEKDSRVNNMVRIYESSKYPEPTVGYYTDTIVVKDNLISHEIFGQSTFIVEIKENDLNITDILKNISYLVKREVTIGEEMSSYSLDTKVFENGQNIHVKHTEKCFIEKKTDSFTVDSPDSNVTYEGDIIVQVCTTIGTDIYSDLNESFSYVDKAYSYFQKDKGRIALVNKNCLIPHKNTNPDNNETYYDINDNSEECSITTATVDLLLE